MPQEQTPNAFPPTPWSLIGRAVDGEHHDHRASLDELLRRYLPALRAHLIYSKRLSPDRADDLLQGFVTDKLIERGIIASAQQAKGKFRTFLLTALSNYHVSEIRRQQAKKRAPADGELANLDSVNDPATSDSPDSAFDTEWARQIVSEATRRMETECVANPNVWRVFKARILDPAIEGREPMEYKDLVERFSLTSPIQVSNLLVTGRRMYMRNLRSVIAEYARDDAEIEEEIRDLRRVLAGAAE
jgi:RNA polymerase sigma-70 factor (ECF subfamily)